LTTIQSKQELDSFYSEQDPWQYTDHPDDARRKMELLSLIPPREFERTLDIGCGNGFLTFDLPGKAVTGVDLSSSAVAWASQTRDMRDDAARFSFVAASLFELDPTRLGLFDLIVITGVLYPQYIGRSSSLVRQRVDALLEEGGILVSCHIDEWSPPRFPYTALDVELYAYRGHTHRLEIYRK
jgi:predicted TPR repeat methyltransferase